MEKVSVATRCPFMNTPNEPESTGAPASLLGSLAAAEARTTPNAIITNANLAFTSQLLTFSNSLTQRGRPTHPINGVPCGSPLPRPPFPRPCRQFRCAIQRQGNRVAAPHAIGETGSDRGAKDDPRIAPGSAGTVRPPMRPEIPNGFLPFPTAQHFRSARTPRRQGPVQLGKNQSPSATLAKPCARPDGIPLLPIAEKSPRSYVFRGSECARRDPRMAMPVVGSEPVPHYSCRRP